MSYLIICILGFIIGFTLSIFILRLNKIKNDNERLMNEIIILYEQLKTSNKTQEEKKDDILNFMVDKILDR